LFISRSPFSYLNNPAEERAKYQYNVDKNMTLLRYVLAMYALWRWVCSSCAGDFLLAIGSRT
jgi:hypothetical protein